jgi:peptidoglycan hydrolase-like protein with peptidoglycan-binding domain
MPTEVSSLWPTEFGTPAARTPVAILREQGAALAKQTSNIVAGRVVTYGDKDSFGHRFLLYCAPLGYESELLTIRHGIDLYPVSIDSIAGGGTKQAANEEQLRQYLKEIFALEKTKKIVAALLAQSKE